jgi:biopolymer transport protein ExbD
MGSNQVVGTVAGRMVSSDCCSRAGFYRPFLSQKTYFIKMQPNDLWKQMRSCILYINARMADINLTSSQRALKVDLTPMVDLGFILISFFLFTTTLTEPVAMRLVMPDKPGKDSSQAPTAATLTLYPGSGSVFFEEGKPGEHPMQEAFLDRSPSVRDEIIRLQDRLADSRDLTQGDLTVIIKPHPDLSYEELIAVLDEMTICAVKKYMIVQGERR